MWRGFASPATALSVNSHVTAGWMHEFCSINIVMFALRTVVHVSHNALSKYSPSLYTIQSLESIFVQRRCMFLMVLDL
jgi:hypothetical protein